MTTPNKKSAGALPPLYKLLGTTPEALRQEMLDDGLDPQAEIEAMRRLGSVLAAKFAPQIEREQMIATAPNRHFAICDMAVAAGAPEWASADPAGTTGAVASLIELMSSANAGDAIWTRVSGWSMRDVGIADGDHVLVDRSAEPREGDVVVAHIAGTGQVVKRLRFAPGKRVILESAHPDHADIAIDDPSTLVIYGVVIGRAGKI